MAVRLAEYASAYDNVDARGVPSKRKDTSSGRNPQDKPSFECRKKSVGSKVHIKVSERQSRLRLVETMMTTSGENEDLINKVPAEVSRLYEVEPSILRADIATGGVLA